MWQPLYIIITSILLALYATVILAYRTWYSRLKQFKVPTDYSPVNSFSIVIPARNEAANIGACIQSILNNDYPVSHYEIIVIDDHSTDNTSGIVEQLQLTHSNIKLIKLADEIDGQLLNAYKKKAIEKAVGLSTKDWTITTDADCIIPEEWLKTYDAYIQDTNHVLVAAPVVFIKEDTALSMFQYIDFLTMQGITAASVSAGFHAMCNGANLAYQKEAFNSVEGFRDIDHIASGDDMFLMKKIKNKYPKRLGYLFSDKAIVATHPMLTWSAFFNQRIRWASKADKLKDKSVVMVLALVYFLNLLIFLMPLLAIIDSSFIGFFLISLILKIIIELSFAIPVGRFFGKSFVGWFILLQPAHIAYTVTAGWLGKFGSYQWKDRKVK